MTQIRVWVIFLSSDYVSYVLVKLQREFAGPRRISIFQSIPRSMFRICRWLSWCRASSPRSMCVRHSHGCTTTGTSPMMGLSFWGLTSIFHQRLCPIPWRNLQGPLVDQWVARLVTDPGNWRSMLEMCALICSHFKFQYCDLQLFAFAVDHLALKETVLGLETVMGTVQVQEGLLNLVVTREELQQTTSQPLG